MGKFFNLSNNLKQQLEKGDAAFGLFHLTSNAVVSEALSVTPLHWLAYDMEAAPSDKMSLVHFLQSMKGSAVTAVVRAESCVPHHLEQVLDTGVSVIIVPKVDSAEQCMQISRAVHYPPQGRRGVNPVRASNYLKNVAEYFSSANKELLVFVQIESALAVQNIESILSVDGIAGVFIGCGDLAMDLGCPAQMESDKLLSAINTVLNACNSARKIPGIFAYNTKLAEKFTKDGFKMIAIGNDIAMLQKSVIADLDTLSKLTQGKNNDWYESFDSG